MDFDKNKIFKTTALLIGIISWLLIDQLIFTDSILFILQIILFLAVIFIIWKGADLLVDSSVSIANHFQVPPFLIGLTIVAFGTSLPELVTSSIAGLAGKGDIAIANVVGSNIFNISIILGGLTLLTKKGIQISTFSRKLDAPLLFLGTLILLLCIGQLPYNSGLSSYLNQFGLLNHTLSFIEALILTTIFFLYVYFIIKNRNNSSLEPETPISNNEQPQKNNNSLLKDFLLLFGGLAVVILGCHILLGQAEPIDGVLSGYGALWFATYFELPDFLIGLSIVALGTSLPEIVVSISSIKSKSTEIGVGNLLGSAIFNLFAVTGITGLLVQPPLAKSLTINNGTQHSLIAMGIMFFFLFIFFSTGKRLSRKEGFVLLCTGMSYMIYELIINLPHNNL